MPRKSKLADDFDLDYLQEQKVNDILEVLKGASVKDAENVLYAVLREIKEKSIIN